MASIEASMGILSRLAYFMYKGCSITNDLFHGQGLCRFRDRSNSISLANNDTPFVDEFLKNNYPDKEAEMFEKLSKKHRLLTVWRFFKRWPI